MSWEAIGAGILMFVTLLMVLFVRLCWRLWDELGALKETRMDKKSYEEKFNTPLGAANVSASGSLEDGLSAGVSASLSPHGQAAASGVGGAMAYNLLLGVAGAWTIPLLLGTAGAVWLYKKQKDAKAAKEFPPGPGAL